jgi:hypothetical protein
MFILSSIVRPKIDVPFVFMPPSIRRVVKLFD